MLTEERRTIEESYASAGTSSNLKVEAERRGDADVLISAGWSKAVTGGVLLRLRTEYDGAEHPRLAEASQFHAPHADKSTRQAGAKQARAFNLHETGILLGKMKTLPSAREKLADQLRTWGATDPETKAVAVIRWWLNPICHECNGTKFEVVPNTGRLSARACKCCSGAGVARVPHGQDGRRLANWIDECLQQARNSISKRLRNSMGRV